METLEFKCNEQHLGRGLGVKKKKVSQAILEAFENYLVYTQYSNFRFSGVFLSFILDSVRIAEWVLNLLFTYLTSS